MSMRENFEMWVLAHWPAQSLDRFKTGEYTGHMVEHAWIAWQASCESVSVKIPSMSSAKYLEYFPDVEGSCFNRQSYIDDLVIALQAAGLRFIP